MLNTFLGVLAATVFGVAMHTLLGTEALLRNPWVDGVFWGLMVSGALLDLALPRIRCWLCARSARQAPDTRCAACG